MDAQRLDEITRALGETSRGQWLVDPDYPTTVERAVPAGDEGWDRAFVADVCCDKDARLIANAPTYIAELLAEVERANEAHEIERDFLLTELARARNDVEWLVGIVREVEKHADDLAGALALALYDAHPVYANTAGWRGGIGGQAVTQGCSFLDPPPDAEWTQHDLLSEPLRDYLRSRETDLEAAKARVKERALRALLSGDGTAMPLTPVSRALSAGSGTEEADGKRRTLAVGDVLSRRPCTVTITSITGSGRPASGDCSRCGTWHYIDEAKYNAGRGPWLPVGSGTEEADA